MKKARISNPYGYYDELTGEFVITRPDTPTPWMNYLGQGGYGGIISNTAGGYSFDRDPRNRRVTRYRYNAIPVNLGATFTCVTSKAGDIGALPGSPSRGRYFQPTNAGMERVILAFAVVTRASSARCFILCHHLTVRLRITRKMRCPASCG